MKEVEEAAGGGEVGAGLGMGSPRCQLRGGDGQVVGYVSLECEARS